jgi:hypothetical protein
MNGRSLITTFVLVLYIASTLALWIFVQLESYSAVIDNTTVDGSASNP